MSDSERSPELRISDEERHAVAELLREAAGEGRIDLDELDERLEATYAARTYADLRPITADLPTVASSAAPERVQRGSVAPAGPVRAERHVAVMSGLNRKGVWTVPTRMTVSCVMGGADLDLRQARFESREVTITVNAVMGGATIVVPSDVDVVMEGVGFMGGFSGPGGDVELPTDPRVLRVRGFAFWGGVQVERRED